MGKPLNVPCTDTMPRDGSLSLTSLGRVKNFQETAFSPPAAFERKTIALKWRLEADVDWVARRTARECCAIMRRDPEPGDSWCFMLTLNRLAPLEWCCQAQPAAAPRITAVNLGWDLDASAR